MNEKDQYGPDGSEVSGSSAPETVNPGGGEIRRSLAYLFQSICGKYSLETYLESLGEFTDGEIDTATGSGLAYRGGEAVFQTRPEDGDIRITVSLEFQDPAGAWKLKKAERTVPKTTFTREAVQQIECAEEMRFEVQEPGRCAE